MSGNGAPREPHAGSNRYRVRVPGLADTIVPGQARLISGEPTPEEAAAMTAVMAMLFAEGAVVDRPRDSVPRLSPWQRTQRHLQGGTSAGDPIWGSFGRE